MAEFDKISYILAECGYGNDPHGLAFNMLKSCPVCVLKLLVSAYRNIESLEKRIKDIENCHPLAQSCATIKFGGPAWVSNAYPNFCEYAKSARDELFKSAPIATEEWLMKVISTCPGAALMVAEHLAKNVKSATSSDTRRQLVVNSFPHVYKRLQEQYPFQNKGIAGLMGETPDSILQLLEKELVENYK